MSARSNRAFPEPIVRLAGLLKRALITPSQSQVDPASYGCKLARKLPERLEATAEVRIMDMRSFKRD
jgi:phage baseplate assembly protein W